MLQACRGSPDGSFQGFFKKKTCLFISVKIRVPQRTVASCCILASFHRDMEDRYPLDRLAVTLPPPLSPPTRSPSFQVVEVITICVFHGEKMHFFATLVVLQSSFLLCPPIAENPPCPEKVFDVLLHRS